MFRRRASEAKHRGTVPDRGRGIDPAAGRDPFGAGVPPGPGGAEQEHGVPEPWGPPPAGLDVGAPHPARVRNYWLGGRDFFAADKAAAEEIGR